MNNGDWFDQEELLARGLRVVVVEESSLEVVAKPYHAGSRDEGTGAIVEVGSVSSKLPDPLVNRATLDD